MQQPSRWVRLVSNTSETNANLIYEFGLNLGLAFQLQDDYLDAFGNPETFGKQVGGDIMENKKTFLYLKSLEVANEQDRSKLEFYYNQKLADNSYKITEVLRIFEQNDIPILIKEQIQKYTEKAFETLFSINISDQKKQILKNFGVSLMNRNV